MNSSFLQNLPDSRWDQMCRRLEPLLGDVPSALGPQWHQKAEALFTEADFVVANAVLAGSKTSPDWFVIRYAPAGRRLDGEDDGKACAPSWSDALAVLLGACESNRCLPSRVDCNEAGRTLRLFTGDDLLATVEPLAVDFISPESRQRALSTICGLRKSPDPQDELLKRARRWPGMETLAHAESRAPHEMQEFREQMAHHPIPREWLASARLLCIACGKTDPGTAMVQAVAAAAFGAQSWNHLAAPHGDLSARLLQPWYVSKGDDVCAFHADAIDAFAGLFARASQFGVGDWPGIVFESQYSFTALDYIPTYTLGEPAKDSSPGGELERQVAANPMVRAETPADELLERVAGVTPGQPEAIASLFGVGLPADTKARMLDDRSQEILVVQDGEWRFTRTGDPRRQGTTLWLHRVGADGNSIWSAAVPTYKGLLQRHQESGTYVLCADYDGAHPVAVIHGLSPLAAAQVRANLPDTTEARMEFREDARRPRDREDFRKLLERALSNRSMA